MDQSHHLFSDSGIGLVFSGEMVSVASSYELFESELTTFPPKPRAFERKGSPNMGYLFRSSKMNSLANNTRIYLFPG
jgi:hypothetical protein